MFDYQNDTYDGSGLADSHAREELTKARLGFYGSMDRNKPDDIEARLREASEALSKELTPILSTASIRSRAAQFLQAVRWRRNGP